jgi:DDE superfamily endonuclease
MASATRRIMTREALERGRITAASQDGCREFVSILACINAIGEALPPALIYAGEGLLDTWLEDYDIEDKAYFGVSENGWSCDAFGRNWLKNIFDKNTKARAGRSRRLLIVDGHSSHVNMKFIDLADSLRILILILPPHSTHRLQPLDVGLFAPLARFYTNGLIKRMNDACGMISMSKRDFWGVFWPAWKEAFTQKNIVSAFEKTGIFPADSSRVIDKITKPQELIAEFDSQMLKTPTNTLEVRRLRRGWLKSPSKTNAEKAFRGLDTLAAQASIALHRVKGLEETLRREKKKKQRGKRLNLLGEEDFGAQLYSPGQVQNARDFQAQKEEAEQLRQQEISDKRDIAAAKKIEKEEEKKQRAVALAEKRQLAAESRAQKAVEKQARLELKEEVKRQEAALLQGHIQTPRAIKPRKRAIGQVTDPTPMPSPTKAKEAVSSSTRTRRVQRPQRFCI